MSYIQPILDPNSPDSSPSHFTNYQLPSPSAITKTLPIHVTIDNHGLLNGQRIRATNFVSLPHANATGMEQLNNKLFTVQFANTNTFDLYDQFGNGIDGTNYTTFVNNGLAQFTLTGPDLNIQNPAPTPP